MSIWTNSIWSDETSAKNFSYKEIHRKVGIPQYQQMIVAGECFVGDGGDLNVAGEVVLWPGGILDNSFSFKEVHKSVRIPQYRQMIVAEECYIGNGGLTLEGEIVLIT